MVKFARFLLLLIFSLPIGLIRSFLLATGVSNAASWLVGILLGVPISLVIFALLAEYANTHQ